jgi:hypothetical protein
MGIERGVVGFLDYISVLAEIVYLLLFLGKDRTRGTLIITERVSVRVMDDVNNS